mgnify:CR=1 FL=1
MKSIRAIINEKEETEASKESASLFPPFVLYCENRIQEYAPYCKDDGEQKAGAACAQQAAPTWDKYPIIGWRKPGKDTACRHAQIRS